MTTGLKSMLQDSLSVRGPLTIAIGVILLTGFLLTNIINYQISSSSLRQALVDQDLPLTSNNIYSEIQRDLLQPVFVASLMASDTFVKDWLMDGEQDPAAITRYLDGIRREYGVFTSFLVSEKTRNYYHFSGLSQTVHENDPRDAWYFRVRDMEKDMELNVDLNAEQNDTMTVFINHRIHDYTGQYIATTGVGLELRSLYDIVARYEQQFSRHIYFVDGRGNIALRSANTPVRALNIADDPSLRPLAEKLFDQDSGFYAYERNGKQLLTNSRLIPELGWYVIVELEEDSVLAPLQRSLLLTAIVGTIVIVVTMALVTHIINIFHQKMEVMATTDRLTGIGNRQIFERDLDLALARRKRDHHALSIILADLDHFKRINDRHGHLKGDEVLKKVTTIMQNNIRESDSICRWGGEEIVILAQYCSRDETVRLADKIRIAVEEGCKDLVNSDTPITASFGVATAIMDESAEDLLDRADMALYRAKQNGRNRVEQF